MRRLLLSLLSLAFLSCLASAQTLTETFGTGANVFSIDFVGIGNPNNAPDPATIYPGLASPLGAVSYTYNIGRYEISRDIVTKANALGGLALTMSDMVSLGGNGSLKPATGISFNEAARFINWLNEIKGYQKAYNFTNLGTNDNISPWGDGQHVENNPYRHKNAVYYIPSSDEWYKAGYGSLSGEWFKYTTGSNLVPVSVASGTNQGTMVINRSENLGPADIVTAGGLSSFGTMAQGGNVWEWSESLRWGQRMFRGGSWQDQISALDVQLDNPPDVEHDRIGFRVAMIPEPSSLSLLALGGVVMALRRRR